MNTKYRDVSVKHATRVSDYKFYYNSSFHHFGDFGLEQ